MDRHNRHSSSIATKAYLGFNMWNPFVTPYAYTSYPVASPVVSVPGYLGASTLVVQHPYHHHYHHPVAAAAAAGYAAGVAAQPDKDKDIWPGPSQQQ